MFVMRQLRSLRCVLWCWFRKSQSSSKSSHAMHFIKNILWFSFDWYNCRSLKFVRLFSEVFYGGETISHRTLVSLTCPYCGISGFLSHTLLKHCLEKHSIISSGKPTNRIVVRMWSNNFSPTRIVSRCVHFVYSIPYKRIQHGSFH